MRWHIVTGEFPPAPGGVSDYTIRLAEALAKWNDEVHVWTPEWPVPAIEPGGVEIHVLPRMFSLRWLMALERGLATYSGDQTLLVQYVPHMYGWKAMNLPFCYWLARHRRSSVWVMFHEVAFPFRPRQPFKHSFLAVVHRFMARVVLRAARQSFTSIEPYRDLLRRLAPEAETQLLRIFSNVPFRGTPRYRTAPGSQFSIGMFSNFNAEISALLEETLPVLLENRDFHVRLIGPGLSLIRRLERRYPHLSERVSTTGHMTAPEIGPHLQACDALLQLYPDGACAARGTLIAALGSGVPVVSTAGPLTEQILSQQGALIVTAPNPTAVRKTLEELHADPVRARAVGTAARRLYAAEFDVDVTVARLRQAAGLSEEIAVNQ